jgi:hypothetical protein
MLVKIFTIGFELVKALSLYIIWIPILPLAKKTTYHGGDMRFQQQSLLLVLSW